MRDKLIGLIASKVCSRYSKDTCLSKWHGCCDECECGRNFQIGDVVDYLLTEGVIVLPCNVGDTVYYPAFGIDRVFSYKVISIKLNSKGLCVVCENRVSKSQMTHRATQIGKTIFLTKAEAEKALAERRTDNG